MEHTNDRQYSNGEIIVYWRPQLCRHVAACVRNLPQVFNAAKRPWVDIHAATSAEIIKTVEMCPTGALSWTKI